MMEAKFQEENLTLKQEVEELRDQHKEALLEIQELKAVKQSNELKLKEKTDEIQQLKVRITKLEEELSRRPLQEADLTDKAEDKDKKVSKMANYLDPLSEAAVGAASLMTNSKQQMNTLDLTKTVIESALQFLYSSKEGRGNPKATTTHENINTAPENMRDHLQDLLQMLENSVSQAGEVTTMIDKLSKSISKTDERIELDPCLGFVDYKTNMVKLAKDIAKTAQDMLGESTTDVDQLGLLANRLTQDFDLLASDSRGAAASAPSPDISSRIRLTIQDLGKSCIELVQDTGNLQANPSDTNSRRDLSEHARNVMEKVSFVLASLQLGSRGTQACINAAHTVSGIIADLDTSIMCATAGTLNADGDDNFADHRENILKTAKALVEDTKTLVAGVESNQEQLSNAAQMTVKTITRLADVVKCGAGSLGSNQSEAQVLLINAVKDVASALSDLINATKNASGKSVQDPAMLSLKESAKTMSTNVTSLLKTVKTVEDAAARGTGALESTIEAIGQEIKINEAHQAEETTSSTEQTGKRKSEEEEWRKEKKTKSDNETETEKKKWSEEEKGALTELVNSAIRKGKPPKKNEVEECQRRHHIINVIPWRKVKYQVWAMAQQQNKMMQKLQE